jgi:hypothetical protein
MAAIQHRAEAAPADIDAEVLEYQDVSGQSVRRRLIVAGEPPEGRLQFDAPALPQEGLHLPLARFFGSASGASRVVLQWTAKTPPGAAIVHWTDEARLPPGGAVRLASFFSRK